MFGVLLLDLDRFKTSTTRSVTTAATRCWQEVASRLKGVLRATDTIARLGGDEFAVVSTDAKHPDNVVAAARKILASLEGTFTIGDHTVETGASIGIAMYPIHGDDPGTLLPACDVAMYVAKKVRRRLRCLLTRARGADIAPLGTRRRPQAVHDSRRAGAALPADRAVAGTHDLRARGSRSLEPSA